MKRQTILIVLSLLIHPTAWASSPECSKALTLQYAQSIANKAQAYAQKKNWKVSIAIVNSEGNLLYFQREPDAYVGSIDSAIQKAQSSNAFQRPTSVFVDAIKQGRLGLMTGKNIVAIEGGIPIILNGKHIGAIGISGAKATEDEETAQAALTASSN